MKEKAYAKINLALDVVGKKENGYHLLKMIMQSIDLYDEVDVEMKESGITLECDKEFVPTDESNIAFKAAKYYFEESGINKGCHIKIKKNIPVAAGLAGGSTDGAAVLRILNKLNDNNLNEEKLYDLALKLGADVPFCIHGGTALCEGVGEIITQLDDFENHKLLLVKPPFGVSTKEVFQKYNMDRVKLHPNIDEMIIGLRNNDIEMVSMNLKNVLENVTMNKHKVLKKIKADFIDFGALGSLMSGSGPSMFGFYTDENKMEKAIKHFKIKYREIFKVKTIGKY